jgi:hypothetical protein
MNDQEKTKDGVKEEFCGACLAIPLALAGAGASTVGSGGKHKNKRRIILWVGIATVILSLVIGVYYLWIKKCSECG